MMICYQITNTITGKVYIGLTVMSLADRWRRHVGHALAGRGYALHEAMRKYGVESFMFEELAEPLSQDRDELAELERILIAQAGSIAPGGYNLTAGGDGVGGCEATARKISASLTGKKLAPEHRAALKAGAVGRVNGPPSEETREKLRVAGLKKKPIKHTEETKEKCRLAGLRRKPIPMTAEHKAKLLAMQVGRKASPETREKQRIASTGRVPTEEARANMRAAQRRIADAKAAMKITLAQASQHAREEVK